ncbi:MAG: glutathione S-transferase family protein [Alphaproteobacteria bacterium]|nr:glutathione S-transferase family protein [Alphaproteobacteria bacterium]
MADELVFYTNPQSRGLTTHWMLEEIGCPYRMVVKQYGPEMNAPDYLAINPMGKVPALVHGKNVVTETGAILAYLADVFPAAKLAPPAGDRGAFYRWLFFIAGCGEPAMTNKAAGWEPTPERQRSFGYGSYERTMDALEKAVAGKQYIAADHFTAADLYVAAFLNFGMMFGVLDKRPAFEAYVKPHIARPACQKVMPKRG